MNKPSTLARTRAVTHLTHAEQSRIVAAVLDLFLAYDYGEYEDADEAMGDLWDILHEHGLSAWVTKQDNRADDD